MTMSDPIADMLTRIRNANTAKHDTVDIPASKMKIAIADILVDEGYIVKYDIIEENNFKTIRVTLKYGADKNEKIISGIKRISKPGLRVYAGKDKIPYFLKYAWGRPQILQRLYALVENFGLRCCLIFIAVLAMNLPPFIWRMAY